MTAGPTSEDLIRARMPNCTPSSRSSADLRHLVCGLGVLAVLALSAGTFFASDVRAAPDPSADGAVETDKRPEATEAEAEAVRAAEDDPAGEARDDLLDPSMCPTLFGDDETRDYNRRVREAKLTWLEARKGIVEITHTTDWKRPFYLELAGVELVATDLDEQGQRSAIVDVNDAVPDCPAGLYALGEDASLGKQAQVIGVLDGVMLVDFEGKLGYLMTGEAEVPTWQMVWRSGWYFIRRREVTASKKSTSRSRTKTRRPTSRKTRTARRR